jgi:pseudouridine synthase
VASRRHAEELIARGAVTVNGAAVREQGTRLGPADVVRVNGALVRPTQNYLYILLNKPADAVCTAADTHGRRTVLDLLPPAWRAARVYPVGRLDRDTEGLLLLTNDGDLALRLTHPRYALPKEYRALVRGRPTPEDIARLERGVFLGGEARPTAPARVWVERPAREDTWMGVELHEGRNRQVRRMFELVGHPVLRLERVGLGPLTLGSLPRGQSRLLHPAEVAALRHTSEQGQHNTHESEEV